MSEKLIIRLSNEIGNQMFMYASALGISTKLNRSLLIDNETAYLSKKNISKYGLDNFKITSGIASNNYKFLGTGGYIKRKILKKIDLLIKKIDEMDGPEVGQEFDAVVTSLMAYGAFVDYAPGRSGLIPISELEWHRVEKVEDVLKPGDDVRVKLIKVDDQGRLDFSRKALLEKPEGYVERPKRPRSNSDRGGKRPFKKRRF